MLRCYSQFHPYSRKREIVMQRLILAGKKLKFEIPCLFIQECSPSEKPRRALVFWAHEAFAENCSSVLIWRIQYPYLRHMETGDGTIDLFLWSSAVFSLSLRHSTLMKPTSNKRNVLWNILIFHWDGKSPIFFFFGVIVQVTFKWSSIVCFAEVFFFNVYFCKFV